MHALSLALLVFTSVVQAALVSRSGWKGRFRTHVAFGDSYTDEARLGYFSSHNGSAPPVGWIGPDSPLTASGGHSWARYASYYTGATLYNYAVWGAPCSNNITPRTWGLINAPFPSVAEYEVPAFAADLEAGALDLDWRSTVVSMWIGTNDLGAGELLTHSQVAGKTIVDYTHCVWDQLVALHALGARHFVLLNIAPLEAAPIYSSESAPNTFWPDKGSNITEISSSMAEQVAAVNEIFALRAAASAKASLPGAELAILDANRLMRAVIAEPAAYLNSTNGTYNVTGYNRHCNADFTVCFDRGTDNRDGFLWYDQLHPSEQFGRVLASVFTDVLRGGKKWASFW